MKDVTPKAKKTRAPSTAYKPGQSGNPNGRPALPVAGRQLRLIMLKDYLLLISKYLKMNMPEIIDLLPKKTHSGELAGNTPALDCLIIKAIVMAYQTGNFNTIEMMMSRLVGKVPDKVEITNSDGGPLEVSEASEKQLDIEIGVLIAEYKQTKDTPCFPVLGGKNRKKAKAAGRVKAKNPRKKKTTMR